MPLIETSWMLLCFVFGAMLILTLIKSLLSQHFYTQDVVMKKFSMMDVEIPATSHELINLIKGLYKLPQDQSKKVVRLLKAHLVIDFFFMPCLYGSIFIICMLVAGKMKTFGVDIFIALAWLQVLPFIFDFIENVYLLQKIKPEPQKSTPKIHQLYLGMEFLKWSFALIAAISAIAAICYFWLSHHYSGNTLNYGLILLAEIAVFLVLGKVVLKKEKLTTINPA